MTAKAYSYIRFSSPEQARGDSRRRQLEAATLYAAKFGLDLVKDSEYEFFDAGISAYRGKNNSDSGKLKRFFDYVESGRIESGSYLLVESLDRLSRQDILVALPRFLDLLNAGIKVVTLTDEIVYSQAAEATQLVMSIFHMSRAHEESRLKGDRVSKAWKQKQKEARDICKPIGSVCPYWLQFDGERYIEIPERVLVVRNIFEWTTAGYGQVAIVKRLNEQSVPVFGSSHRNRSQLWGSSSIAKILANRAVLGEYQPMRHIDGVRRADGPAIEGYYPRVIDESLFYAAQNSRAQRNIGNDTRQSKNFNVWSKVAICAYCRSPMNMVNKGKPPKGNTYLRCSAAAKGKCHNKHYRYDSAGRVFREILANLNSMSLVKGSGRELNEKISELRGRITAIQRSLEDMQGILLQAPSVALSNAAAVKEGELNVCEDELSSALKKQASEVVFNKEEFFKNLDLDSYEGRASANYFVRSLGVQVKMKFEPNLELYSVSVGGMPKFVIEMNAVDEMSVWILSADSLRTVVNQNELGRAKFIFAKKAGLRGILKETKGNGREAINFNYKELKRIELSPGPSVKAKVLKSLGLDD